MKQIRVLIIDDETIAIEVIRELVIQLTNDLTVVGTAKNGVEALEKISTLAPDLVFLDINMPLMNGMEVLENLSGRSFQLIFTTGYESHAMKTNRHLAVATLLKPIDPADFLEAVTNVRQHFAAGDAKQ